VKALVIAPQPFFSPRGTPFSVYYRTLIASELGVKMDLLTYGEGEDVNIKEVRIKRIPRFCALGSVKIGPSYLKAFLDFLLLLWTIGLLLRNRYSFVHVHEEAVIFCRFLKPIFRFKLIYDMHSSLPQQLSNFKFTRSKIIIGVFKILEDSCLKAADAVITICPDLSSYVKSIIHDSRKHILIENSIFEPVKLCSTTRADNSRTSSLFETDSKTFNIPQGKKIIVYTGTLEQYQGIELLIDAFRILMDDFQNAFLLVAGGNKDQVSYYKNLASERGIKKRAHFTGQVEQALANHYCRSASVLVSPRTQGTNTPLKVYQQLASGIPLVATTISSHTQVLKNDVAFLVEPNPEAMAQGILQALSAEDDCKRMVQKAKKLYEEKYSRPVYERKMQEVLKMIA
jgi:glycosyltransferase involved in cell wall biosynthesis